MSCICCESAVTTFLDLGQMAFANAFIDKVEPEEKAPLRVGFCPTCSLVQLTDDSKVEPEKLFRNYTYFTSTSPQTHKHFDSYAEEIVKHCGTDALVVEVAANDGLLLKCLKKRGLKRVVGVDPATNVVNQAIHEGLVMINNFFTRESAAEIEEDYGRADVVIANNVLAHTPNPKEIVQAAYNLLKPEGVFVVEVQHLQSLIEKNEWTNIYHEHFSYYSLLALDTLFANCGLWVAKVDKVDTQGGSLRVWAVKQQYAHHVPATASEILEKENMAGLHKIRTFNKFAKHVQDTREKSSDLISMLRQLSKTIVGYGAPAKGNTFLGYCGFGPETLWYITDEAPSKQGKLTPGTHIPVSPRDRLLTDTPDYILLLAWNYQQSIIDRESWFRERGGKFISIVPTPGILYL